MSEGGKDNREEKGRREGEMDRGSEGGVERGREKRFQEAYLQAPF